MSTDKFYLQTNVSNGGRHPADGLNGINLSAPAPTRRAYSVRKLPDGRMVAGPVGDSTSSAVRTYAPAMSEREQVIAQANRDLAKELDDGRIVMCSHRAWINQSLREAGLGLLTVEEGEQYSDDDDAMVRESQLRRKMVRQANSTARPTPEQLDAEWNRNAGIRSDFGNDKASFMAYKSAEALGLIRMYGAA